MSDDDKPFVCLHPKCGMRFTNEDRLTVHTQKHEMSLALAGSTGSSRPLGSFLFPADQTPTPTKFIRNCEEMGLFQELKNPFEESFKKAISGDDNTHPPLPGLMGDIQLQDETPLVLKNFIESEADSSSDTQADTPMSEKSYPIPMPKKDRNFSRSNVDDDLPVPVFGDPPVIDLLSHEKSSISLTNLVGVARGGVSQGQVTIGLRSQGQSTPVTIPTSFPMQVVLQLPSGQAIPVQIPTLVAKIPNLANTPTAIQPAISTTAVSTPNSSSIAKQKLKEALTQSQQAHQQQQQSTHQQLTGSAFSGNMQVMAEAVDRVMGGFGSPNTSLPSFAEMTQSAAVDSTVQGKKRHCSSTDGDDVPDDRRTRFLERNRAAASRCRNKKKEWVSQLEKKADDLHGQNTKLQSEVTTLKSEIAQLKSLLLAHKDCPITLEQESQGRLEIQTIEIIQPGMPRTEAHIIIPKNPPNLGQQSENY